MQDTTTESAMPKVSNWIAAGLAFLFPIAKIVVVLAALVILDGLSGIWAAYKRGELPQSFGLRLIPAKLGGFCIMVLAAYLVDYLLGGAMWVTNITAGAIAIHEFQSIVENVEHITGYKLWDAFVNKLRGRKLEPIKKKKD